MGNSLDTLDLCRLLSGTCATPQLPPQFAAAGYQLIQVKPHQGAHG